MIIWKGLGILVIVIFFAVTVTVQWTANALFGPGTYFLYKAWLFPPALFVVAASCWFLGRYLHQYGKRELIDTTTGQKVVLRSRHSLFFIPMEYWAVPLVLWAFYILVFGA